MAFTPTDPTKAEVRITGTAPNQALDFYIPRGAKGEPGGITLGTILGTADLNTIITPGVYRQTDTSGNSSGTSRNYPTSGGYGVLTVHNTTTNSDVIQEFTHQSYNTNFDARRFYRRHRSNGVWSEWRVFASTRVDQTAGRAIYQWDDTNLRDQLVYGDTGLRNLEADVVNGWTATIFKIRRVGYEVTMHFYNINPAAQTGTTMWTIPTGFRPPSAVTTMGFTVSGASPMLMTSTLVLPQTSAISASGYVHVLKYTTIDAWPTTLPGTASGTIPNL